MVAKNPAEPGGVALGGGGWELEPLDSHGLHAPSFVVAKKLTRTHGKIWISKLPWCTVVRTCQKNLAGKANSVVLRGTENSSDFSTRISQPQMTESHLFLEPEPLPEHEPSNGCGIETIGTWTFHQKQACFFNILGRSRANPTFNMFKVACPVTKKNLQWSDAEFAKQNAIIASTWLSKQIKIWKKWHTHHFAKRCQT